MLSDRSILITGGTGSFGKRLVKTVLENYPDIKRLVVFSRDELKQFEMSQMFSTKDYPRLKYFIGDVRDKERLIRACEGIDTIVHAAALKQVPAAEYNPMECIKTNVQGAENVIEAALHHRMKDVIALSTDKAAAPVNLYGATKLCSDKLFCAANYFKGARDIRFSVVRYGNVFGSRGSVIPLFLKQKDTGAITVTHKEMTRFNITLQQGVDFVLQSLERAWGGEIFVPKIPSYRILDVAAAIAPHCEIREIGIRPGEKLHEEMITVSDSFNTLEFDDYYVIKPNILNWDEKEYLKKYNGKPAEPGFNYSSGKNDHWLTIEEISQLVMDYQKHYLHAPL